MFDLFGGVTSEQINQANQTHVVNHVTLLLLLIEKGIISAEEVAKAKVQATHFVEQGWAKKREEAETEFDEKHPGMRDFMGKTFWCG